MSIVRTSLNLFGGDTVVIRCSDKCQIELSCEDNPYLAEQAVGQAEALHIDNQNIAYVGIPYSGIWNVLIDSKSDSLEHSISYLPA